MIYKLHSATVASCLSDNNISPYDWCDFFEYGTSRFKYLRRIAQLRNKYPECRIQKEGRRYYIYAPFNIGSTFTHYNTRTSLMSESLLTALRETTSNQFIQNILLTVQGSHYFQGQHNRHFHLRRDGTISYTPKHRKTILSDAGNWSIDGRQMIKTGKALRQIFSHSPIPIPNADDTIAKMTEMLLSKYTFNDRIEIVEGNDIVKYYNADSYDSSCRELYNSCMRYDSCSEFIKFYSENPERVRMLVAFNAEGKLTGRALLWRGEQNVGEDTWLPIAIMDRIYGRPVLVEAFKDYASNNGFYYKNRQSYQSANFTGPQGQEIAQSTLRIPDMKVTSMEYFPYIDTFRYSMDEPHAGETITLSGNSRHDNVVFESTGGSYTGGRWVTTNDGTRIHQDDASYIERWGEYVHSDDATWSDYDDEFLYYEDTVYSDILSSYLWDDRAAEVMHVENGNFYSTYVPDSERSHVTMCHYDLYEASNVEFGVFDEHLRRDDFGEMYCRNTAFTHDGHTVAPTLESLNKLMELVDYDADVKQAFIEHVTNLWSTYENRRYA